MSGTYSKDITFFLGRPVWKVISHVYYLLTKREPAVKGGDRGKILYSSQNFLLKITSVYSKCRRMTNLKHFGELLNLFSLTKITYPFVLLKTSPLYFSKSQINYSLKTCRAKEAEGEEFEHTFQGPSYSGLSVVTAF